MSEIEKRTAMVFEQQPRESAKAFEAFSLYLNMGAQRSLKAAGDKLGKSKVMMEKWSKKFDWPARVAAHAAHHAMIERKAMEEEAREKGVDWAKRYNELREMEWKARCELVDLAWEVIGRWRRNPNKCGTLEGIARLLDLASTIGRKACDVATEKKELTGPNGGPIRIEIEAALDKIYGKPIPGEVIETVVVSTGDQLKPETERLLTGGSRGSGEGDPESRNLTGGNGGNGEEKDAFGESALPGKTEGNGALGEAALPGEVSR